MAFGVLTLLVLIALATTIAAAVNRCPLWVPVFILTLVALLERWPK